MPPPKSSSSRVPAKPSAFLKQKTSATRLLNTPLYQLLLPFKPISTQWFARYVIVSFVVILRLAVGVGSFSGFQAPPMYGDFEAQRHWMEITTSLPMQDWYWYDLQWWGLDYPPLTAYHSWLCGKLGSLFFNPMWFALDSSRGNEDPDLKSYMRLTAVISEILLYIPCAMYYTKWKRVTDRDLTLFSTKVVSAAILIQPTLVLIDHGHFQYNSVMLGFALASMLFLCLGYRLLAACMFVCAVMFKQMALYYALIIFAYLLGECVVDSSKKKFKFNLKIARLMSIAAITTLSFCAILVPFMRLESPVSQLCQMVIRVFPFNRGLWEDKVANFWCAVNTVVKLKMLFSASQLQKISLIMTLLASLPAIIPAFLLHSPSILPWAMSAGAWAFFLFSFQVHEKSVLLPLMPAMLLLADSSYDVVSMVIWINNIAQFSLWPLLQRDGLILQYIVLAFLWNWLLSGYKLPRHFLLRTITGSSYILIAGLHLAELYYRPISLLKRYPDLWVVANVTLCCACFTFFYMWTIKKLWDNVLA